MCVVIAFVGTRDVKLGCSERLHLIVVLHLDNEASVLSVHSLVDRHERN